MGDSPKKVEVPYYCIMIARLVIDYFCRVFKEPSWQTAEAWESFLSTICTSVFSNQNCELSQHDSGDLLLMYLEGDPTGVKKNLQRLLQRRRKADLNQISWR